MTLPIPNTFSFMLFSCCCCSRSRTSLLASSSLVAELADAALPPADVGIDLSILLASSISSFIEMSDATEDCMSDSFGDNGLPSPSDFRLFALVGLPSPVADFGLVQLGDMWSVAPQVQHLLFSSFASFE